jgi:hypothetical protein
VNPRPRPFLILFIGLGLGVLLGAGIGWLRPIQDVSGSIADLHPAYKEDYTVMVGEAYLANGDWDLVQARLGRLEEPDPVGYVVLLTEQFIADGRSPEKIRYLVALAARYGYITEPMLPYLAASPGGQ